MFGFLLFHLALDVKHTGVVGSVFTRATTQDGEDKTRLGMKERCGDALATVSANSDEALSWRVVVETAGGPHLRTIRCSKLAEMVKLGKAKLPASCSEVEGYGELAQARWDNGRVVAPLRRFW